MGRALPASPDHRSALPRSPPMGHAPPTRGEGRGLTQRRGAGRTQFGSGILAVGCPPGALSLPPPLGGTRMCVPGCPPILCGSPRGDAAVDAPGESLPGHMGLAPVNAGEHSAVPRQPLPRGLLPRPPEGGPLLPPYARRPPRAPPSSVLLAVPQSSHPPGGGSGTRGALCMENGAPSCARCKSLGWGISRCCRAGHEGHCRPTVGTGCPPAQPQGRAGPPGPRPTGATRGSGGTIRLAAQGAPRVPGPPGHRDPGDAPVRGAS